MCTQPTALHVCVAKLPLYPFDMSVHRGTSLSELPPAARLCQPRPWQYISTWHCPRPRNYAPRRPLASNVRRLSRCVARGGTIFPVSDLALSLYSEPGRGSPGTFVDLCLRAPLNTCFLVT